jgi:hypothetical protein
MKAISCRLAASFVLASFVLPASSHAAPDPTPAAHPGDVAGIKIGMTPPEAMAILKGLYPNTGPVRPFLSTRNINNNLATGPYVGLESVQLGGVVVNDDIEVLFTSPSSGNRAYMITRKLFYGEGHQTLAFDDAVSAMQKKYGDQPTKLTDYTSSGPDAQGLYVYAADGSQAKETTLTQCPVMQPGTYVSTCGSLQVSYLVFPGSTPHAAKGIMVQMVDTGFLKAAQDADRAAAQKALEARQASEAASMGGVKPKF